MSPDGRRLAFAAPAADAVGVCCSTIILVDLASGARRTWNFHDDGAAGDWLGQSTFTKLAWSPDSRRLAFTVSYEGDTVAVDLAGGVAVAVLPLGPATPA